MHQSYKDVLMQKLQCKWFTFAKQLLLQEPIFHDLGGETFTIFFHPNCCTKNSNWITFLDILTNPNTNLTNSSVILTLTEINYTYLILLMEAVNPMWCVVWQALVLQLGLKINLTDIFFYKNGNMLITINILNSIIIVSSLWYFRLITHGK